jgi:hypothetical protein
MRAKLLETQGYALEAIIEIDNRQLHVMDDMSPPGGSADPGSEFDIELSPLCLGEEGWDQVFCGNPDKKMDIERLEGWEYIAFGKIIQLNPVVIDCGILTLENEIHTHDERCMGEYVAMKITRLAAVAK